MKAILSQLIDDFHERGLPELVARNNELPEIQGKANAIIGMRRTGKTFFCYQKIKMLLEAGVQLEKLLYLNFEDDRLFDFTVSDFQTILDVYYGKYPEHQGTKCYFFFDEIQRVNQWELFIRRLLDTQSLQICLTGSSSKLLSTEIATSLRGRSLATEIFPFSFLEFIRARGLFTEAPGKFGIKTASVLRKAIKNYLDIGGFPEIQRLDSNLHAEILQGYVDSVLLKDVIERHKICNVIVLKHLIRHIMNSPCGKFSVNKFYNTLRSMSVKCTKNSLYDYLDYLTDAFLFYKVPVHHRSEKVRMVNPPKIYTIDSGLLNAMTFRNSVNNGLLLENMVFLHLRRNHYEIESVNTKDGFEVDFFIRHKISGEVELIQVCWDMSDKKTFNRELRGLHSAAKELSIASTTIVTWDDEGLLDRNVHVVPVWKWLLTSCVN